jgi:Ca2+/Na+ antiporter
MSSRSIGRIIVAIVTSYTANAILVVAAEALFLRLLPDIDATRAFYIVDLISQCLCTVVAGYLCCVIARPLQRIAMAGLIILGVLVGTVSLATSWKTEPHWYGVALLFVYPPCVWIGWTLKSRTSDQSAASQ